MRVIAIVVSILVGSGLGALLGATRSCESGGCPLTANPWRGALWGGFLGLMVAMSMGGPSRRSTEQPAPAAPPTQTLTAPEQPGTATPVPPAKQPDGIAGERRGPESR